MYIEKYHYSHGFDIDTYYSQFQAGVDYDPLWPIICVSTSRKSADALETFWSNLLAGKKRSKPSIVFDGAQESVHTAIAKALKMRGMVFSVLSACTSGAYAVFQAAALSKSLNTPVVVTGADDTHTRRDAHFFGSLGAMSADTGIPFDKNSKGFRPGMGQCFFIVSHRPIDPIAKIDTMRFFTQTEERTDVGSVKAIQDEMFEGIDLSNISWWNAHAPGTPVGDQAEYALFNNVCNDDVVISSVKGHTGHLLATSYLVELGHALDSVRNGFAKGNKGIVTPINNDQRIIQVDTPIDTKSFIKFNMGFGGKNVLSVVNVY